MGGLNLAGTACSFLSQGYILQAKVKTNNWSFSEYDVNIYSRKLVKNEGLK